MKFLDSLNDIFLLEESSIVGFTNEKTGMTMYDEILLQPHMKDYFRKKKIDRHRNAHYLMDVKRDRFIHFTTLERLRGIVQTKKLLMNPPYDKFGIDAVTAVSAIYGESVPGVQTTHNKEPLAAIFFSTRTIPQYGRVEEVIWDKDVEIKSYKIITMKHGIEMLNNSRMKIDDQDMVHYSKESFDRVEGN